ncbi:MAG: bifunctional MaoC family dehydratase N-terminal/OB-fold nucleic acid binding domain-containing protein [Acidimicrobiales bacterium]
MTIAWPDHSAQLEALVGSPTGPPSVAPDAVNAPMIRHWVEAMGDTDPVYVSAAAARSAGLDEVIAPPTMLQAWTMRGLRATAELELARSGGTPAGDSAQDRLMALLDDEGMTSVVATDCEQTYARPLRIGDRLVASSVIESISGVKRTALGEGRFATTRTDIVAVPDDSVGASPDAGELFAAGEPVATMRFRILKFRPAPPAGPAAGRGPQPDQAARPKRPRPAITEDIAFWFEGARRHRLLIQRCAGCGELRHPPLPACASCRSFEWDTVEASGRGTVFSFVVVHYPQVPAFDYPLAIGLVELEEGTRLVADLVGLEPSEWRIGRPVEVEFVDHDDELTLPVFRPVPGGGEGAS